MPPSRTKPTSCYRIIHSADWHLGKMLGTLDRGEEHRLFLQWLEGVIVEFEVDALIIAGDLFDSATPPQSAVRLYFDFLASLHQRRRECRVVVTAGNHDSPAHLESPRDFLQLHGVHISATLPENLRDLLIPLPSPEEPRLIVAALPFLRERDLRKGHLGQSPEEIEQELREGIIARYREAEAECARFLEETGRTGEKRLPLLATGHLTALGGVVSESEREIHVGGLGRVAADAFPAGFSYVALGHLHRPQAVGGREHIRYSGSPLSLSFSESRDKKEVRLLDFEGAVLIHQEALPVPVARPLLSLSFPQKTWRKDLAAFEPPVAASNGDELLPWVEITITEYQGGEDLVRAVHEASAGRGFEVIRVLSQGAQSHLATDDDGCAAELASPKEVFLKRLEGESLEEVERRALLSAFDELRALYEERRRQEV